MRVSLLPCLSIIASQAFAPLAHAGLPRGAVLMADEQDADETTGVTIARGHAEISVETQRISGHADAIELRPPSNEIVFKGGAAVSVGTARYDGETVTCTLDFTKCATAPASQVSTAQPIQPPSGVGAAVTNPR